MRSTRNRLNGFQTCSPYKTPGLSQVRTSQPVQLSLIFGGLHARRRLVKTKTAKMNSVLITSRSRKVDCLDFRLGYFFFAGFFAAFFVPAFFVDFFGLRSPLIAMLSLLSLGGLLIKELDTEAEPVCKRSVYIFPFRVSIT